MLLHRFFLHILFSVFLFYAGTVSSYAQTASQTDSAISEKFLKNDTEEDSIQQDSLKFISKLQKELADSLVKNSTNVEVKSFKIAENDLEEEVKYTADDSIIYDIPNKKVYLYGHANIKYQEMDMYGGFIQFDWDSSEVYAKATPDSLGYLKKIQFKDGTGEYMAEAAKFNFKTKKGKSYGLVTKEMEGFLHGDQVKVVDSVTLYVKNARYTTCDLDDPHFYIEVGKAKVVKDKYIVGKPANLVIEKVRTPLVLPFAFLPNIKSKGSGLLTPTYGQSTNLGYFFQNIGYYWHINDKMDLTTTADIYTLGSWALRVNYNLKLLYKFYGTLNFTIAQQRGSIEYERFYPNRKKAPFNFGIQMQMNIDPKRMYNSSFNANINITSSKTFQYLNSRDPQSVLSTTFTSNISYSKWWPGKPFQLSVSSSLNQNTQSKVIAVTVPSMHFSVTRINPFQSKVQRTKRKWYENIGFSYDFNAQNTMSGPDSLFFNKENLKNIKNSITHSIPISGNFQLFKYINFNVNFNYNEKWFFNYTDKQYYNEYIKYNIYTKKYDTIYNKAISDIKFGFKTYRDFNLGFSFGTNLYGLFQFKKSKLQAIHHRFSPSLNFNFAPDFTAPKWKYMRTVQADSLGNTEQYSIYSNNGVNPAQKQGTIGLRFSNTIQIKVKSKKDTVNEFKKISLLDALDIGLSYNMLTKQLSPLNINGNTRISEYINLSFGVSMNPYSLDSLNRQTKTFYWKEAKRFFRFTNAQITINGSIRSKKAGSVENQQLDQQLYQQQGFTNQLYSMSPYEKSFYNFTVPWSVNYSYSFSVNKYKYNKKDTLSFNQGLSLGLDINITSKWKLNVSSGFDFSSKKPQITRTDISVIRDLHCWQLEFRWTPFGYQAGYFISLYVTSQQFSWLRLQKQKAFFDSGFFGSGGVNSNAFGSFLPK